MSDRDLTTPRRQVFGTVEKGTDCRVCGRNVTDGRMVYCSDYCRTIANRVMEHLNWTPVRRMVLDRDGHTCQECGFRQAWIDCGHEHLRAMVEARLPEDPESPSILRYGEGDVSDEEIERVQRAWDAYMERREELIGEFFNVSGVSRHWFPTGENRLEVDHVTPISEGGHPFDPANLRTLCVDCHEEKTVREHKERAEARRMDRPEITLVEFAGTGGEDPR